MGHLRLIDIDHATDDLRVGTPINDSQGRTLVEPGTRLTPYIIEHLKSYNISKIVVEQNNTSKRHSKTDDDISTAAKQRIKELYTPDPARVRLSSSTKKNMLQGMRLIYDPYTSQKELANTAKSIINDLMKAIKKNDAVTVNVNDLRLNDRYTYSHSIDVATIAIIIGKTQKRTQSDVFDLGMAGLLHDIGKMRIPKEILHKPTSLTPDEYEIVKKHTIYAYEMLEDNADIKDSISLGILQHHEKLDGSGYPNGDRLGMIHPYAKILAIADIFDAMVTSRPYRKGISPRKAAEMLLGMSDKLDIKDIQAFLNTIILYPANTIVRLSNGESAKVIRKNPNYPMRPVVVGIHTGTVYDLANIQYQNITIE
ncbi:MAG: HD-GYP domain-containing protein [Eubacterium sp.]|nr:HD-GYP domain-containing protein [Eubacterium sp.]